MSTGDRLAAAAEALLDAPFRLHGRDPETGIDCIGLVLLALQGSGRPVPPLPRYTIRSSEPFDVAGVLGRCGFAPAQDATVPGDLLVVRPGPGQVHFLLVSRPGEAVHAHAALGRVVATPFPLPWPVLGHWRLHQSG